MVCYSRGEAPDGRIVIINGDGADALVEAIPSGLVEGMLFRRIQRCVSDLVDN